MQTNFLTMETEWKEEKQKLMTEIEEKNEKIKRLEEHNTILENSHFEMTVAHSKLLEEIELKTLEVVELQEKIKQLSESSQRELKETSKEVEEEKGSLEISDMEELTKKIELLEHINFEIRQTNKDLENQLTAMNVETKTNVSPSKKGSPLPSRKGNRNTASKMKSPWSKLSSESLQQETEKKGKNDKSKQDSLLQALNKEILDKEFIISQKESLISELQSANVKNESIIKELQSLLQSQNEPVKMISMGTETDSEQPTKTDVVECTPKVETDLEEKLKVAQAQIAALNEEIEASNKNMIKVKSNSKLKLKQMQKTIENFSKVSDAHAEIVKLNEELHQLAQKVAELEEEKGNLQLHLVDYDSGRCKYKQSIAIVIYIHSSFIFLMLSFVFITVTETEIYKKMIEMENLAEARDRKSVV